MSSKQLLQWCRQIAEGMSYLSEEKDGDKPRSEFVGVGSIVLGLVGVKNYQGVFE